MANTKANSKNTVETKQTTIQEGVTTQQSEKEISLQNEVEQLKAMVEQILASQKTQQSDTQTQDDLEIDDEVQLIVPNKLINVTSLFYGGMSLTGTKPIPIRFDRFGMTLPITFEDLTMICSNHRSLAENGAFFIHNKDAIKALYLEDHYKRFINKQTIENIITLPDEEIRKIYNNVTNEIKETITDVVIDGVKQYILHGEMKYSNRNKIELLSELSGKNIFKLANDAVEEDKK